MPSSALAAVLLGKLLEHQSERGTTAIAAMVRAVLGDQTLPLGGLSTLLHELHFADYGRWKNLVDKVALRPTLARCWAAIAPSDVMSASFLLSEAIAYLDDWEIDVLGSNAEKLTAWMENATDPMGHGLARLLNTMLNKDERQTLALIRSASPTAIARLISSASPSSVWQIAEMAKTLRLGNGDAWASEVIRHLDGHSLLALSSSWPDEEPIYRLICLFEALAWPAEALTLDLVEAFLPAARRKLVSDPVEQFRYLDDLAWHVLRVLDPLGTYKGKLAPTVRHLKVARKLLAGIDLVDLAAKLSRAPLRSFQQVSFFIAFAAKASPATANKLLLMMDWEAIGLTIGDHWTHLPHDAEVLFGVAARSVESRKRIVSLIRKYIDRLDSMPARLALVAPELALELVRNGKSIALAHFDHVEWRYGAYVIGLFAQESPQLLPTVLAQCVSTMANKLGQRDASCYRESAPMLEAISNHAPDSLQLVLDQVNVAGARVGWTTAWTAGDACRKTAKVLLKAASDRPDALGEFARQFRPPRRGKS